METRGEYSYRWVVGLQIASSLIFKTRGSGVTGIVIPSANFTGKHNGGKRRAVSAGQLGKFGSRPNDGVQGLLSAILGTLFA